MENVSSAAPLPLTAVVRGTVRTKVLSLTVADPQRAWNAHFDFHWNYGEAGSEWSGGPARLPYADAKGYRVVQGYHGKSTHFGEFAYSRDWQMPEGTEVRTIREGVVAEVEERYSEGGLLRAPSVERAAPCARLQFWYAQGLQRIAC